MLPGPTSVAASKMGRYYAYHASTWECVPAESDTITVLNFAPLVFESFVVHDYYNLSSNSRNM